MRTNYICLLLFLLSCVPIRAQKSEQTDQWLFQARNLQASHPDSALKLFAVAERLAVDRGEASFLAEALKGQGVCYYFLRQYDSALFFYDQAMDVRMNRVFPFSDSINLDGIAALMNNKALALSEVGKQKQALILHKRSARIRSMINDKTGLANLAYNSIGMIYFLEGDYSTAVDYFFRKLKILFQIADVQGAAFTLDQIGAVYYEQGDFRGARKYYLGSLRLRVSTGDSSGVSASYNQLGLTEYALGRINEAKALFHKAIAIKSAVGDICGLASVYNNIGLAFQEEKQFDSALVYGEKAVFYARACGDMNREALALINTGVVYAELNRSQEAFRELKTAFEIADNYGFMNLKRDAAAQLAELYAESGHYIEAYQMKKTEGELNDSLSNKESLRRIAVAETRFRYETRLTTDSVRTAQVMAIREARQTERSRRQTMWLIIIIAFTLFAGLLAWLLFNRYRLSQKNKEHILRSQAAELKNALLRSQMNPHFIFNSMNSIQGFIASNDALSAGRYLSRFATLIRHILENSDRDLISLSEETEALKLYAELEKVRFSNRFCFSITVSDAIDPDETLVPPLILQPFVENAIIHGVLHLDQPGEIHLDVSASESFLVCIISDNGVGRARAAELKKRIPGKNRSMGIDVTLDRLFRMKNHAVRSEVLQTEDLFDAQGNVSGTKVTLKIPLIVE